ncbi:MAG TPA: hypothetical protein VHQ42_08075 [Candidatus Limnocylindria bacterium]|nr:hypothetical protein [Candidatus Limnocylindria bacterium]
MTVQQHAPTLERARPTTIANATIIAAAVVVLVVLAVIAAWALLQQGAGADYYSVEQQLQNLRETIGSGGWI